MRMVVPVAKSSQAENDTSGLSTGMKISRGPVNVATIAEQRSGTIITLTAMWSNAPCAVGSSLAVTVVLSTQNDGS